MNYLKAREILSHGKGTGKYHFTSMNDGITHPVGYCTPHDTCQDCKGWSCMMDTYKENPCKTCNNKGFIDKENPCKGHDTPEEAAAHYRRFLLDTNVHFSATLNQMEKCLVCGEFTTSMVIVGCTDHYRICDKHNKREELEKLYPKIGEIWSS